MSSVRWRLLIGLFSLAATLALTVPAAASRFAGSQVGEAWPNATVPVADSTVAEMWPNLPPIDDIWPNNILFVDSLSD